MAAAEPVTKAAGWTIQRVLILALVLLFCFPFVVMISTAVKPRAEVLAFPPHWLPSEIRLQNFADMWQAARFGPALTNSLLVSIAATVVVTLKLRSAIASRYW